MTETLVNPKAELSIPHQAEGVGYASAWLEKTCREFDVPADEVYRLDICLNEALANVMDHGGMVSRPLPVCLQLDVRCNEATVTISDPGVPFNPLLTPVKSMPETLADAEPGGLGILMIRNFSDSQQYLYSEGNNQLTFSVRW